jgi:hypothetical protein
MIQRINRIEETVNRKGEPEVFVEIFITDDLGIYPFAHWLTPDEYDMYTADKGCISTIMESYLTQARQLRLSSIAFEVAQNNKEQQ